MRAALPAILGNGVGGVVAATGPGVDPGLVGRRVVASLGGTDGYAERAVAAAAQLVEIPDPLSVPDATALLADGRTALMLVRRAEPRAGETVLVEAAAGGVGTLLVQLAARVGARVVAVAGGERKLALARELGAEVAVDYSAGDWTQHVRDAVGAVDVVFDGVGGRTGADAFSLLRIGGRFVPFGMASGAFAEIDREQAQAHGIAVLDRGRPSPHELRALTAAALDEAVAAGHRPGARARGRFPRARRHRGARDGRQDAPRRRLTQIRRR